MSSAGDKRVEDEGLSQAMFNVNERLRVMRNLDESVPMSERRVSTASFPELTALKRHFRKDSPSAVEFEMVCVVERALTKKVADRVNSHFPPKKDKAILLSPEEAAAALRESDRQLREALATGSARRRLVKKRSPTKTRSMTRRESDPPALGASEDAQSISDRI